MIEALVDELLPELLPESVVSISELIGYSKALRLVSVFGGFHFAIPLGEKPSRYHQMLIDAIGDEATKKLISRFGGERLYIPKCHAAFTQMRNRQFREEVLAAKRGRGVRPIQEIARKYGFSERWAQHVLKEENERAEQMDLFNF